MRYRGPCQNGFQGAGEGTGDHGQTGLPSCAERAPAACFRHVQEVRQTSLRHALSKRGVRESLGGKEEVIQASWYAGCAQDA